MKWIFEDYLDEELQCLFCKGHCDIESKGTALPPDIIHRDTLTCTSCGEYYQVFVFSPDKEGFSSRKDFAHIIEFSCENMVVSLSETKGRLAIRAKGTAYDSKIDIPQFDLDLTDKAKLQEKLKTYLVFS